MRLEGRNLGVLGQRGVGVKLLVFLVAADTDIYAIALSIEEGILKFRCIAYWMKTKADFQVGVSISTVGMQMH